MCSQKSYACIQQVFSNCVKRMGRLEGIKQGAEHDFSFMKCHINAEGGVDGRGGDSGSEKSGSCCSHQEPAWQELRERSPFTIYHAGLGEKQASYSEIHACRSQW